MISALVPALALVFVFAALAALHIYWGVGGSWGRDAAVPEMNGRPLLEVGPLACFLVAALLSLAAALCLARVDLMPIGDGWARLGVWGLVAVFLARAIGDFRYVGFFKSIRDTRFAANDTRLYSPLCVLIATLALWLASAA